MRQCIPVGWWCVVVVVVVIGFAGCKSGGGVSSDHAQLKAGESFADDLAFLRRYSEVIQLQDVAGQARVAVAPEYQGRVMTSTAGGDAGPSFGFIHRENVAKRERVPHINVFGGEDRFWLGPESGQFGLYFPAGSKFELANWQVPEAVDWGPWLVLAHTPHEVRLQRDIQLQNYSGTTFVMHVDRAVRVLERPAIASAFGIELPASVSLVGYESENLIRNTGPEPWTKETGLVSIWVLGMYKPSAKTTIVIPFVAGPETELGPTVNDAYFGKIPSDRLKVETRALFFRGDGQSRGKIGISRPRARPIVGSYAAEGRMLTLVQYTLDPAATDYVNSMWQVQEHPYAGDVVNSYNDGPPEPGKRPLGPFYELETSSKAAELAPAEALTHVHRTLHVTGPREALDAIAQSALGVTLAEIENAFP
ncbi:MAG TPA: DUF6786 family protein [Polyangiales bacterium]|nr:DUF6786 family protein [Polyangiales bacterium]